MSETITITLTGPAAEAVEGLVARGDYPTAEAAVADAVLQLAEDPDELSPEWTVEIRRRIAEHEANPDSALSSDEVRARLAARFAAKR
jgi:putative addiction module component (TIGR02574 family)